MVVATEITSAPYRAVFQNYVASRTKLLSGQVRTQEGLLSEELQERIWLTLGYALRPDQGWVPTRELLLTVAPKMEQLAYWEEWLVCLEAALDQCRVHHDPEAEAELSMHYGNLLQRMNRFTDACVRLQHAQQLFRSLGLSGRAAIALARMANLARRQHDYAGAARLIENAFALLAPDSPERAYCCFVRGLIALDDHQPALAEDFLTRAQTLSADSDNVDARRLHALALLNLGRVFEQVDDYARAEEVHLRAIAVLQTIDDPVNLAVAQMDLGIVYMERNKLSQALAMYEEAEATLRHGQGSYHYLAMIYNNRGMTYDRMGDGARAIATLQTAIEIWKGLNDELARLNVESNLGRAYITAGDLGQAQQILEQALVALDHLQPQTGAHLALREELLNYLQTVHVQTRADAVENGVDNSQEWRVPSPAIPG